MRKAGSYGKYSRRSKAFRDFGATGVCGWLRKSTSRTSRQCCQPWCAMGAERTSEQSSKIRRFQSSRSTMSACSTFGLDVGATAIAVGQLEGEACRGHVDEVVED